MGDDGGNFFFVILINSFGSGILVGGGGAKRGFAGRNDRFRGEAALRGTHSQAALGNDKGGVFFLGFWLGWGIIRL